MRIPRCWRFKRVLHGLLRVRLCVFVSSALFVVDTAMVVVGIVIAMTSVDVKLSHCYYSQH